MLSTLRVFGAFMGLVIYIIAVMACATLSHPAPPDTNS